MKVVITIAKKIVENKGIIGIDTEEIVIENVASFLFDEGYQRIRCALNDNTEQRIELQKGDENHLEQWFLADVKCFQVPLKVKL